MAIEIRGPRALLRRFGPADLTAMRWLVSDPGLRAAVEEMGTTESDVRSYLEERSTYEDFEQGRVSDLAVALIDGPVIGMVTLVRRLVDQGEVGYALHGDYRGSGYATEAAGLLIDHVFGELGFHRVYVWVRAGNQASVCVARRLGFRLEGRLVEAADTTEPRDDVLHLALLRREWEDFRR